MATQALPSTTVYDEKFRLFRVFKGWAVTVLTGDDSVKVLSANVHDVTVALSAVLVHFLFSRVTVLERLVFPKGLVVFVVITVHETVFTGAKVVRDVKHPKQQERGNDPNDHEQRTPNMTFHNIFPLFL
jgi:hypothetical protein